jgi:hypothetical protein
MVTVSLNRYIFIDNEVPEASESIIMFFKEFVKVYEEFFIIRFVSRLFA